MEQRKPRRPAIIEPNQTERITSGGAVDDRAELAHFTADLILGRLSESEREYYSSGLVLRKDAVEKLSELLEAGDIEVVSELWADSPAETLPGMLWRLYLVYQWYLRDSLVVQERYQTGRDYLTKEKRMMVSNSVEPVMEQLAELWKGHGGEQFAALLEQVSQMLTIMAGGVTANWISNREDILADHVTLRPEALLRTAEEFAEFVAVVKAGKVR